METLVMNAHGLNNRNQRVITLMVALLVLAVPLTVAVSDEEQVEESDAIIPIIVVVAGYTAKALVASFIAGAVVGGALVSAVNTDPGPNEEETRRVEAQLMAQALMTGIPIYTNAIENYTNIWALTGEHWVRQAEIAASSYWTQGAGYDANLIMDGSRIFINNATMMANATNQINEQFLTMNEHVGQWNDSEVAQYYGDGQMKLQFAFGSNSITVSADDQFVARMGTVVRDVTPDANCVYYAGGPIYLDNEASVTITGSKGHTMTLNPGWNWYEDADTFEYADIYELESGATYFASSMTSVVTTNEVRSAFPQVAFAFSSGNDAMIVSYDKTSKTLTDGTSRQDVYGGSTEPNGLKINILAEGVGTESEDLAPILVEYADLQSAISTTQNRANTSAMAVWSIYDSAGSASVYLTTLTVPDTYQNVTFNEAQKRMITILAMDQLAEYWNSYGGDVKKDDYRMTLDSMSLYCRGSITIPGGETGNQTVYEDVIYTPIFYRDQSLKEGSNRIDQQGFVMVWSEGKSLASYDGEYSYENADLLFISSGSTLGITEMRNNGESIDRIELDAAEVDWIDAEDMEMYDPYDPEYDDLGELIRLIFIIIGAGLLLYGASKRSIPWIVVGIVLIVVGFVFADAIAKTLNELLGWQWLWPF